MTREQGRGAACDTSVLVPALVSWHPEHEQMRRRLTAEVDTVPAHVLIETFSVLTRLPAPHRLSPTDAGAAVEGIGLEVLTLPGGAHVGLVSALARRGVRGGAAYDALVAATAKYNERTLLTRDRRAASTYDLIGVGYTLA